jgi:hypothetical protein
MAVPLIAPAPLRTVRTIGGTLFRIALDELGDAEQWPRIAALNGLVDPWLTGSVTIKVPPRRVGTNSDGSLSS